VGVDDTMDLLTPETFGPVAPVRRMEELEAGTVWFNDPS